MREELEDISPAFMPSIRDTQILSELMKCSDPQAEMNFFEAHADQLTDYAYWFLLGNLWIDNSRACDIQTWRRLFEAPRPLKQISLMKPSEFRVFGVLDDRVRVYRAGVPLERGWIAYTLDPAVAIKFAHMKRVNHIQVYRINKSDVDAIFLRREEFEVICTKQKVAEFMGAISIFDEAAADAQSRG